MMKGGMAKKKMMYGGKTSKNKAKMMKGGMAKKKMMGGGKKSKYMAKGGMKKSKYSQKVAEDKWLEHQLGKEKRVSLNQEA